MREVTTLQETHVIIIDNEIYPIVMNYVYYDVTRVSDYERKGRWGFTLSWFKNPKQHRYLINNDTETLIQIRRKIEAHATWKQEMLNTVHNSKPIIIEDD